MNNSVRVLLLISLYYLGLSADGVKQESKHPDPAPQSVLVNLAFIAAQKKVWTAPKGSRQLEALKEFPSQNELAVVPSALLRAVSSDIGNTTLGKGNRVNLYYKERQKFLQFQEDFWRALGQDAQGCKKALAQIGRTLSTGPGVPEKERLLRVPSKLKQAVYEHVLTAYQQQYPGTRG